MGYADHSALQTNQPLTELGMDSLMAVRIRNTVRGDFGVEPPVALLLQGATLTDLTSDLVRPARSRRPGRHRAHEQTFAIEPSSAPQRANVPPCAGRQDNHVTTSVRSSSDSLPPNAIAVVGMAGRFPGADSVSGFWNNLLRGEESIVTLSEDELIAAGVSEKSLATHAYITPCGALDGIDEFDADFFGFTPQAARMTDPQHRLFLQCAWHALEDAGYDPARIDGSVGVYGTSSASGYMLHNLMSHHDPNVIIGQGADASRWSTCRCRTTRISGHPGGAPVQSARPRHLGSDGLLVVAGRGSPGLPEPAER